MYPPNMKSTRLVFAIIAVIALAVSGCMRSGKQDMRTLTLAVNSGVEGDALKQAAKDYEAQTGVHINIAEFPYANLFEKELIDLTARAGAYDLIMLDDPWFPKFASQNVLTDLTPLLQKRGKTARTKTSSRLRSRSAASLIRPVRCMRCLMSATRNCCFIAKTFSETQLERAGDLGRCARGGQNDKRTGNKWRARRRKGLRLRDAGRARQRGGG